MNIFTSSTNHLYINCFLLLFVTSQFLTSQITLTHNVGSTPIKTDMSSCEREEYWARAFTLSDFGISTTEQFIIRSGAVAISNSYEGARIIFNVYAIDSDFPVTEPRVIADGNLLNAPEIGSTPEIVGVDFFNPIVVPAGIERILVEVRQMEDIYNPEFRKVKIAGTELDNDVSWFRGCREYYSHVQTDELSPPVANANFMISVTGDKKSILNSGETVLLNPGIGDTPIETRQYACTGGGLKFARTFLLEDFGVPKDKEYVIRSTQAAISRVGVWDTKIQVNIYSIDEDFPESLSDEDLIGSSQIVSIPYFGNPKDPRIFNIEFETPVVVPAETERIMIEVFNLGCPGYSCHVFFAGIQQNRGLSWIESANGGCPPFDGYKSTEEMGHPEINYFIRTSGEVRTPFPYQLDIGNRCSEDLIRTFDLDKHDDIISIRWNFGDPLSGTDNISNDFKTSHTYSANGEYLLSADIQGTDGKEYRLERIIYVSGPPEIERPKDLIACEDVPGSGTSSSFSTAGIHDFILKGRDRIDITYFDSKGTELLSPLPAVLSNSIPGGETIRVRVAYKERPSCYSETSFKLIVNSLPVVDLDMELLQCADATGGFATFNLMDLKTSLLSVNAGTEIDFYYQDTSEIVGLETVRNKVEFEEDITIILHNINTGCTFQTQLKLLVNPSPIVSALPPFIGCDDNQDGISEYFDTADLSLTLIGSQENIAVSYFDENNFRLPDEFPGVYTNTVPFQETITAILTNTISGCTAQTQLIFQTSEKPQIGSLETIYVCDEGDGSGTFNLSQIEKDLIGDQEGLSIYYFDRNGNSLPNPLPELFRNTEAWKQTITIRVENTKNRSCVSETTLDLIVVELPDFSLEESYFLCNLEPSLKISVSPHLDSYQWRNGNGDLISDGFEAEIIEEGIYSLTAGHYTNGIYCETIKEFDLIRSVPPSITEIMFQELSNNNRIEIKAAGDGDFEYSLDGVVFQEDNKFEKVWGGIYTVYVRDKNGCGEDFKEITLLDYPKFFTPNNDGRNDSWNILGISKYPLCEIYIYDRYGKLIAQLNSDSIGWDGTYMNSKLPSSDYWFRANLGNGKEFAGHFTLKR